MRGELPSRTTRNPVALNKASKKLLKLLYFSTHSCIILSVRDTARLIIRKIQYAPSQVGAGPKAELCKSFMMSDKPVQVEASMEKDVQWQRSYYYISMLCYQNYKSFNF